MSVGVDRLRKRIDRQLRQRPRMLPAVVTSVTPLRVLCEGAESEAVAQPGAVFAVDDPVLVLRAQGSKPVIVNAPVGLSEAGIVALVEDDDSPLYAALVAWLSGQGGGVSDSDIAGFISDTGSLSHEAVQDIIDAQPPPTAALSPSLPAGTRGLLTGTDLGTSRSVTVGYVTYVPFYWPGGADVTAVGAARVTASAANLSVGIYAHADGKPGALLGSTVVAATAAGRFWGALPLALPPGWYWAGTCVDASGNWYGSTTPGALVPPFPVMHGIGASYPLSFASSYIGWIEEIGTLPAIAAPTAHPTGNTTPPSLLFET